jgi:hypothetical protein
MENAGVGVREGPRPKGVKWKIMGRKLRNDVTW